LQVIPPPTDLAFVLLLASLVVLWAALKVGVLRRHLAEGGEAALPRMPGFLRPFAERPWGPPLLWALSLGLACGALLAWAP